MRDIQEYIYCNNKMFWGNISSRLFVTQIKVTLRLSVTSNMAEMVVNKPKVLCL